MIAQELEVSLHMAFVEARQKRHEFITVEHLLLALLDNPSAQDSALVIVANVNAPVVIAPVPRFDLKTDTTFTVSILVDMRNSGELLGSATLQVLWNPALLIYVADAEGAANANATVNRANTASGSLVMAMASSSGIAGSVELRKITFRAAPGAGVTGTLAVSVIDLTGATRTNLAPKTVSGTYPLKTR